MARPISLTMRAAASAQSTGEVPIVLAVIRHANLDTPVRLSSDPTQRLTDDPLVYGTVHNGDPHYFVMMSAVLPDDQPGQPPKTSLVFENVSRDMAAVLRSITTPARVDLTVVLASTPNMVEAFYSDLRATRGTYDAAQVSLDISREPWTSEPCPAGRMTRARFPGLFL